MFNGTLNVTYFCSITRRTSRTRMLADFAVSTLSNDMKLAVQKNQLGCQIFYRNSDPLKKRRLCEIQLENFGLDRRLRNFCPTLFGLDFYATCGRQSGSNDIHLLPG